MATGMNGSQKEAPMFNYKASTALVTGASKGLGAAFAEALAANEFDIRGSLHRRIERLSSGLCANKYGGERTILTVDLSDPESPQGLRTRCRAVAFMWIFS
jgi:hypothetical protein